jgi:hypothetical protein
MTRMSKTMLAGVLVVAGGLALAPPLTPALAQGINLMPEVRHKTPDEIERDRKVEEAYKAKLRSIPDAQATDPWGGMRAAPAKPAAKPAARPNRDVDWSALNRKP